MPFLHHVVALGRISTLDEPAGASTVVEEKTSVQPSRTVLLKTCFQVLQETVQGIFLGSRGGIPENCLRRFICSSYLLMASLLSLAITNSPQAPRNMPVGEHMLGKRPEPLGLRERIRNSSIATSRAGPA